jgi:hypothetical protein
VLECKVGVGYFGEDSGDFPVPLFAVAMFCLVYASTRKGASFICFSLLSFVGGFGMLETKLILSKLLYVLLW